jgi:lysozyme
MAKYSIRRWFFGLFTAGVVVTGVGMNTNVLDHIKDFEGLETSAYKDIVGVATIGYGHTNRAGTVQFNMGDTWTEEYAAEVLDADLTKFWDAIDAQVTVDLTDCQLSVLTSWAYNVGTGATGKSTLVRLLNQGNYDAVPAQLMRWDRAGGKQVRGLTRRRAAEAKLWETDCK